MYIGGPFELPPLAMSFFIWHSYSYILTNTRKSARRCARPSDYTARFIMRTTYLLSFALSGLAAAHGSHNQKPIVSDDATWMEKHMAGNVSPLLALRE